MKISQFLSVLTFGVATSLVSAGTIGDASSWTSSLLLDPANGIYPVGGSGQVNGQFSLANGPANGGEYEIALRASLRGLGTLQGFDDGEIVHYYAPVGTSTVNNIVGSKWNFDYSIDFRNTTDVLGSHTAILKLDIDPTIDTNYLDVNLASFFSSNAKLLQDSSNYIYLNGVIPGVFNPNTSGIYDIRVEVSSVLTTNHIRVHVPDHSASVTLLGLGLLMIGYYRRKNA